jgi:hypothetical protein
MRWPNKHGCIVALAYMGGLYNMDIPICVVLFISLQLLSATGLLCYVFIMHGNLELKSAT